MIERRCFLNQLAALGLAGLAPATRANAPVRELIASWQRGSGFQLGQLFADATGLRIQQAIDLPTRAHGLLRAPDGSVLAVARRPGDWLLRWHPASTATQWQWIEPERGFTGHLLVSSDGRTVFTGESDLLTGAALFGVRDARSLEKRAEWPTQGIDPHALSAGAGLLLVANGGVATRPETGRARDRQQPVDSSLVALDSATGAPRGQWRLDDSWLSLRHLAWGQRGGKPVLGIALQAQHDNETARAGAPVLALWDGQRLATAEPVPDLAGYGGDIGFAAGAFVIGCPRAHCVAHFSADGALRQREPLPGACAIAIDRAGRLWAAGEHGTRDLALDPSLRLDNHWLA